LSRGIARSEGVGKKGRRFLRVEKLKRIINAVGCRLLLAERNVFSEAHEDWASRMGIARQKNRPGDILVLADETPAEPVIGT